VTDEWQNLTFQEVEKGMRVYVPEFPFAHVEHKDNDSWILKLTEYDSVRVFASDTYQYKFRPPLKEESSRRKKNVLTSEEIYSIILSNSRLMLLTKKDIRQIERAVLKKLNDLGELK